jgi:uncharacterized damage-inducible protein DinB
MNPKETYRWQGQLSAEQRRELQNAHDHHPKPYVRERSAARLQMAEGKIYTITRGWVIWHVIEHDIHHGGEIAYSLGMHGLTAPDI